MSRRLAVLLLLLASPAAAGVISQSLSRALADSLYCKLATATCTATGLKSATTTVSISAATAPSSGQVLTATSSTAATWQAAGGVSWPLVAAADSYIQGSGSGTGNAGRIYPVGGIGVSESGPAFCNNANTGSAVTCVVYDLSLISVDRNVTWPNADGTITIGGNTFTGTGNVVKASAIPRTLAFTVTTAGNVLTGEDDLWSQAISAATSGTNGDSVVFYAAGTTANNANTKRLRVHLIEGANDTTIVDSSALILTAADYLVTCKIVRATSTTFRSGCTISSASAALVATTDAVSGTYTWANAGTLKITGEATASDDAQILSGTIDWKPAP